MPHNFMDGYTITPILQISKIRLREVNWQVELGSSPYTVCPRAPHPVTALQPALWAVCFLKHKVLELSSYFTCTSLVNKYTN